MKDYTCAFAQFIYFIKSVEGEDTKIEPFFWFNKKRISTFLKLLKVSNKAPNTLGNKAKIFSEVSY
jgi:hypothetical protein